MSLAGASDLRARIKAVSLTFKGYGRKWADETVHQMQPRIPIGPTGETRRSIKRKSATQKRATVVGKYTTNFIDAGSKAHDIEARRKPNLIFEGRGGRTIFARKVHKQRIAARPFKAASAQAAMRKHPMKETMIDLWNKAA